MIFRHKILASDLAQRYLCRKPSDRQKMFYRPTDGHDLPHNPFSAIVAPRPIGWISTRSADGIDNLAPYSFFNAIAYTPPQVMFASGSLKDSVANARDTGFFCANIVGADMAEVMNLSSETLPPEVDEFDRSGAIKTACNVIPAARVAGAPAALECRTTKVMPMPEGSGYVVFGEVVGVHLRDDCLRDGRFDVTAARTLSRLGYRDYAEVKEVFELIRPDEK